MSANNSTVAAASTAVLDERMNMSPTVENASDGFSHSPGHVVTEDCLLYSFVVYTIIVGLLCIVGLIGNLLSFAVFWMDKIKTSTSFLFQGLSMIDSLLLIAVFPIYCIRPFVEYTGKLQGYSQIEPYFLVYVLPTAFLIQTATIWVTVLVAVNRYIAVCKPYQASRLCTVAQARKQLTVVLIFAIIYNAPKYCEAKLVTSPRNETIPEYTALGKEPLYWIIYGNVSYLVFLLILPLLVLTILNVRLINALNAWKQKRAEMQTMRQQQDNNVTFVLIIVVLVFTVCQAPALVNQVLWNVLPESARLCRGFQFYYQRISNMLVILNSSVNFLIYFLFNTRFKQVLLEMICKREYKTLRAGTNNANNHQHKDLEGTNETLL